MVTSSVTYNLSPWQFKSFLDELGGFWHLVDLVAMV